jgi:VanZ family protein
MNSRLYLFRALTVGWMLLVFFLSSRPDVPAPELFRHQDKVFHLLLFGVLGLLLAFSFTPPAVATWRRVFLVTALVTAYGITDEMHQLFVPGREASVGDVLADAFGGFLAATFLFRWGRHTRNPSPSTGEACPERSQRGQEGRQQRYVARMERNTANPAKERRGGKM